MRFFIELSYNGTAYHGWQNQPNAITVQQQIETALSTLLKTGISLVGAGRTDTAVHARMMVAHFDFESQIDDNDLVYKLNAFLPADIRIISIQKVKDDAHARFDALSRTYQYEISSVKDPFRQDTVYYYRPELDVEIMNSLSKLLLNHKNFKCFSRSNTDVKTYNCTISRAEWIKLENNLTFEITADRFLRNMVRAIVGTLIEAGQGRMDEEEFCRILESEDRTQAGPSAPAHGLFLTEIKYPETIFINGRD